ncbi:MAG: PspA/IM30 family protein, partial [Clostridium sp.]
MSILSRFTNIMSLNVKSMLYKNKDSTKEIKKILDLLNDNLLRVKAETNGVRLQETRSRRELDDIEDEINKLERYAKKSTDSGRESEARRFLNKKSDLSVKQNELMNKYNIAKENSEKIDSMYNKLLSEISNLNLRWEEIKGKTAEAKVLENKNKLEGTSGAFNTVEGKADKAIRDAQIMNELNNLDSSGEKDDFDELFAAL